MTHPRIAVIGAGAVGGVLAALADRAGHAVAVTARGAHLAAIRETGLHLSGAWGTHTAHPRASETLAERSERSERPDLAILTVKAQDARSALAANAEALEGVPLLVVQNGLGGAESAAAQLPTTPVIGALALFAASYLDPGRVDVTNAATTYLGRIDHPASTPALLEEVASTLREFIPIDLTANFAGAQWTKLIVNHVNALPAITGLSVQETVADPALRRILTRSMQESIRIALAAGIHFEPLLGLDHATLTRMATDSEAEAERIPMAIAEGMGPVPNPASTLQSLRRGQLTEIDHLNGAVITTANSLTRQAPLNHQLVALVHQVERTGRFIPPADLSSVG